MFSHWSTTYFLSLPSPLWTLFTQTLAGSPYFFSTIYMSATGTTRLSQNSSCWGILPRKPCPLWCHKEPLWHSSGKWSRGTFPFLGDCGASGGTDVMRRSRFKTLILCAVVSMSQGQTAQFMDCIMQISLGHYGLEKLAWDIKQQKVITNVQRNCMMSLDNIFFFLSFCVVF